MMSAPRACVSARPVEPEAHAIGAGGDRCTAPTAARRARRPRSSPSCGPRRTRMRAGRRSAIVRAAVDSAACTGDDATSLAPSGRRSPAAQRAPVDAAHRARRDASRGCRASAARRCRRRRRGRRARRSAARRTAGAIRPARMNGVSDGDAAGRRSSSSNSAPATATIRSSSNSSSGPSSVISSVAASRALPTSALARRCDTGSIGPATGTPRAWNPQRPRSCTVVSIPGLTTCTRHAQPTPRQSIVFARSIG